MRAVQDVTSEEDHVTRVHLCLYLAARILTCHAGETINCFIGVTGIDNGFNVAKFADTVVSDTVGIGVNRLVLGPYRHPHAPILLICTVKREHAPQSVSGKVGM